MPIIQTPPSAESGNLIVYGFVTATVYDFVSRDDPVIEDVMYMYAQCMATESWATDVASTDWLAIILECSRWPFDAEDAD